jgi:hypothetical protein
MAAATPNKLDIKALVNQINLATETLTIGCAQTTESSESQHSESHDRQKLLAAAQNLVLTLELPEITALKIAKGVCLLQENGIRVVVIIRC